jgi:hypothetical protein
MTLDPIPEDEFQDNVVKLTNYVSDPDDILGNLSFSIHSLSQSGYIDIFIDDNNWLDIHPKHDFDGTAQVTLKVIDDEHNSDLTTVDITITPTNDLPIVDIVEPKNGSTVGGETEIIGSAYDAEDELSMVEIRIGDGDWVPVNGLSYWTYTFDVDMYRQTHTGAKTILVKARAKDATGNMSFLDMAYLFIRQPKSDTDGDGYQDHVDRFITNPNEWSDSDDDGFGDNTDKFKRDETQWNDTDGDGYGDNPNGNNPDIFPFDPTQWNDLDRDGHGDNPWGNEGDHYPNDPEKWQKEGDAGSTGKEPQSQEDMMFLLGMLGLVVVIVLMLMVFAFLFMTIKRNKKEKENESENE